MKSTLLTNRLEAIVRERKAFDKARRRALARLREGLDLHVKRQAGSHRALSRADWEDVVFAFHDDEEIGPTMLARLAKRTGLTPEDL